MASSAGTIKIKVEPDLSDWDDAMLDKLAEKVAEKLRQPSTEIHYHFTPAYPVPVMGVPWQVTC